MAALCTHIDNHSNREDAFVVSLADTSVTEQNVKKVSFAWHFCLSDERVQAYFVSAKIHLLFQIRKLREL